MEDPHLDQKDPSLGRVARVFSHGDAPQSGFIPRKRTLWEIGLFQHREGGVGQAWIYFHRMPESWKKRLVFRYNKPEDLEDIINVIRIEAILSWGERDSYGNSLAWGITSTHWGRYRIYPLYKDKDLVIPRNFEFNLNTIKEDIRHPFTYYFYLNEHIEQFSRFDVRIRIEQAWIDNYEKIATKIEWEFIQTQRDAIKFRVLVESIADNKKKYEKNYAKEIKNVKRLALKIENRGRQLNRLIKKGKFTNIKEVYLMMGQYTKELWKDYTKESVKNNRKTAILLLMIMIVCVILLSLLGLFFLVLKLIRYLKTKTKSYRVLNARVVK